MTSKTTKLTRIRERKVSKSGLKRKNIVRRVGTTAPDLALTKPNANERAQKTSAAQ
jgi:hypothetical protein